MLFSRYTEKFYRRFKGERLSIVSGYLLLIGIGLSFPSIGFLRIVVITFCFSEISGLTLAVQRLAQTNLQKQLSLKQLAFLSLSVGCLVAALLISIFMKVAVVFGAYVSFLGLGVFTGIGVFLFRRQIASFD